MLQGLKKGLSVNDLGNYSRVGIRVVISVNSDKGLGLATVEKGVKFIDDAFPTLISKVMTY